MQVEGKFANKFEWEIGKFRIETRIITVNSFINDQQVLYLQSA
jgi:hypothetical protein